MNTRVPFTVAIVLSALVVVGLVSGALLLLYSDSLMLGVVISFFTGALITVVLFLLIAYGVEPPSNETAAVSAPTKGKKGKGRPRKGTFMAVRGQIFKEDTPKSGAIFDNDPKKKW